jgi:septum formation protein
MLNLKDKKLILASGSPRRKELLAGLDLEFELRLRECDENYPSTIGVTDVALYLAKKKASVYLNDIAENEIIITSDTIVVKNDHLLNKPKDEKDAFKMLQELSGDSHMVITGVCLSSKEKQICFDSRSIVSFKELDNEEISYYLSKYKPYDKAGSYGIQEWIGYIAIEKIEGSYFNIVGFPVHRIYEELKLF